jgi:peptidoglycan/xylan/chitin deacetylase (PgdA/CDA1 family)
LVIFLKTPRISKTALFTRLLKVSGALAAKSLLVRLRRGRSLTILAYHRVMDELPEDFPFDEDVVSCTSAEFEREMTFVRKHFDVISFEDLDKGVELYRNPLIITFDDGYKDNHDVVLPILRRHGFPATFFITTGYVGTCELPWWDDINYMIKHCNHGALTLKAVLDETLPLRSLLERKAVISRLLKAAKLASKSRLAALMQELRTCCGKTPPEAAGNLFMNWDDVKDLVDKGMEIGSHAVSHSVLSRIEAVDDLRKELIDSRNELEKHISQPVTTLAYPVGGLASISDQVVQLAREAGYRHACLYENGVNPRESLNNMMLLRIKAEVGTDFHRFRAKVLFPGLVRY